MWLQGRRIIITHTASDYWCRNWLAFFHVKTLQNIQNVLGLVYTSEDEPPHREYVEKKSGVTEKLAYLIVNDLRSFGFFDEDDSGFLRITPRGEKALHGIARRIYQKRFMPEMLNTFNPADEPQIEQAQKEDKEQTSLF